MDKHSIPAAPLSKLETADALANGLEALDLPRPDLAQLKGLCLAAAWIADKYHNYLEAMWQEETRSGTMRF
ncbi:hypothetical protein HA052_25285 [Chromobacterium haemolyticum]|uniref:Uncharacterized protein n=1 Tax=Chromobacterium fluminis TaxID=3044269 RepID=A0ABX0LN15_9NEIS|nr:hypothetical protein [Chromobacterium haemolyticum]NHR08507.1 hypothetical protein [Chromobacterium haemolyticum]